MWPMLPTCLAIVVAPAHAVRSTAPVTPPHFEGLMAFGATAMFLMLLCRGHHYLNPRLAIGTSLFAILSAIYGFLLGAWPLGIGLTVYSAHVLVPLCRRPAPKRSIRTTRNYPETMPTENRWTEESRMIRMFGRN